MVEDINGGGSGVMGEMACWSVSGEIGGMGEIGDIGDIGEIGRMRGLRGGREMSGVCGV